jgi:MFS family permease
MVIFLEVVRRLLTHLQHSPSVNSVVAVMAPLISYLTPEVSDIGARIGISSTMSGIGSLLGAPICGAVLTSHYIWWRPAVLAGSIATSGTILFASMQFILKIRQKTASKETV